MIPRIRDFILPACQTIEDITGSSEAVARRGGASDLPWRRISTASRRRRHVRHASSTLSHRILRCYRRQFDGVFVHDAVGYMTTEADLRMAIETALVHCRPGGAALFAPDFVRKNFRPSTECGGHDNETHGLRYLEWTWDPDPTDTTYVADYAYLLRTPDGAIRVEHDRHVEGLFKRADWLRWLSEAGFQPRVVPLEHSELEPGSHEVFVAKRPGG